MAQLYASWLWRTGRRGLGGQPHWPGDAVDVGSWCGPLILAGAGAGLPPEVMCQAEVRAGRFVRLLPRWQANSVPAWVVLPSKTPLARTRAFVDHLMRALAV